MKKLLLLLLFLSAPAFAQDEGDLNLSIVVVKPRQIYLVPGGQTKKVRIQGDGTGFDMITSIGVFRGGKLDKHVKADLKTISRGIYDLNVTADKDALYADDYVVRLRGKSDYRKLPLDITVVDPQHPPETPPRR